MTKDMIKDIIEDEGVLGLIEYHYEELSKTQLKDCLMELLQEDDDDTYNYICDTITNALIEEEREGK